MNVPDGGTPAEAITAENIPQEWLDLLDKAAGKDHSRTGSVVACLIEILNLAAARATATERERMYIADAPVIAAAAALAQREADIKLAEVDGLLDKVAIALHDAECYDRTCNGPALGAYYRQARVALDTAVPLIAARAAAVQREADIK